MGKSGHVQLICEGETKKHSCSFQGHFCPQFSECTLNRLQTNCREWTLGVFSWRLKTHQLKEFPGQEAWPYSGSTSALLSALGVPGQPSLNPFFTSRNSYSNVEHIRCLYSQDSAEITVALLSYHITFSSTCLFLTVVLLRKKKWTNDFKLNFVLPNLKALIK